MKRVLASALVAGLAIVAFSTDSNAGANANAKIQLHLATTTSKAACTRAAALPACQNVVITGTLYPQLYFEYLLITDGDATAGLAGLQFGIQYAPGPLVNDGIGVDIFSWTLCATLQFITPSTPAWPASGTGNLITWDATAVCQRFEPGGPGTGVTANAGYFYMTAYTPGTMSIIPRPVDNSAKVADCNASEDVIEDSVTHRTPSHLGSVGFGGQPGYSPCGIVTPVEKTTWGAVKSIYSNN